MFSFSYQSRCVLVFALTNHSLRFAVNFSIGLCMDQPFVKICYEFFHWLTNHLLLGWSLLDLCAFVLKYCMFQYLSLSLFINNIEAHNCRENDPSLVKFIREFFRECYSFEFEPLIFCQWDQDFLT